MITVFHFAESIHSGWLRLQFRVSVSNIPCQFNANSSVLLYHSECCILLLPIRCQLQTASSPRYRLTFSANICVFHSAYRVQFTFHAGVIIEIIRKSNQPEPIRLYLNYATFKEPDCFIMYRHIIKCFPEFLS